MKHLQIKYVSGGYVARADIETAQKLVNLAIQDNKEIKAEHKDGIVKLVVVKKGGKNETINA